MKICGFNKTTLLDYPGRVACTIFLGGCNFCCPFCQNGALVVEPDTQPEYSQEEILAFLKKRKGILDGVCISGGEPTLATELPEFLSRIRELGYDVKLDTNGSRPSVVKNLAAADLINKVAMDIKACPSNYPVLTGVHADLDGIRETAGWLLDGHLDYEFRTTVVRELHSEKRFSGDQPVVKRCKSLLSPGLPGFRRSSDTGILCLLRGRNEKLPGYPVSDDPGSRNSWYGSCDLRILQKLFCLSAWMPKFF